MAKPGPSSHAAMPADDAAELARLRERIDAIDSEILAQLNERAAVVCEVGRLKHSSGAAVYEPRRERDIVARLAEANAGHGHDLVFLEPRLARETAPLAADAEDPIRIGVSLGFTGTYEAPAGTRNRGYQL